MTNPPAGPRCSFCGKPAPEVDQLVAGPGVQICNECVGLAVSVIDAHRDKPAPAPMPLWTSMADEEMLHHIPRVAAVADQVEADLRAWVAELRSRGVTWARIGGALGVSRQSAWERFSGEE
ncbi:ClpX C4-type zinc finger protein [Nocardiopsis sediminis]|uniref:ClpX C4-type zinc finger protein n=1 Tax=Nocardiopsis sediminis TaxID=1778267 RepID=A0ABV8FJ47_9ACTN